MQSLSRLSSLGLPLLFALAACGAPPDGTEASAQSDEALARPPIPPIVVFVPPSYYGAGPNAFVQMAPSASSICLLQGVSGMFDDNSSYARIVTQGGYYYLQTGQYSQAHAVCAPWSDFSGTGMSNAQSTVQSTINSPWWEATPPYANGAGYTSANLSFWPQYYNQFCTLSGIGGQWAGLPYSNVSSAERSAYIGREGHLYLGMFSNGPGITADANCFVFPTRSQLTSTGNGAHSSDGSTNVALGLGSNDGICGLDWIEGKIAQPQDTVIIAQVSGQQHLQIFNGLANAGASCLRFAQQGS